MVSAPGSPVSEARLTPNPLDFNGKVVLVTGAASGIGLACARAFARAGAQVVLSDIDEVKNRERADGISKEFGARTLAVAADVAEESACQRLIAETTKAFGRLDVLVNNAGIVAAGTVLDLKVADFDRVLAVNMRSAFMLTQLAAREMVERKIAGSIINMASVNSVLAIPNQVAYVSSKGALQQFTKAAALGLAEYGIRVNAIGPGSIMTEILKKVMTDDAARRNVLSRTPMGRLGEPDEIASVALFLASDMASYMTGQTLYPDGGRLALNYTVPVREE